MFKLLAAAICIYPIASIVMNMTETQTQQTRDYNPLPYEDVMELRINNLEDCRSATITVEFHGEYIESHSSEYLIKAAQAIENCELKLVELEAMHPRDADSDYEKLANNRFNEVKEILTFFDHKALVLENRDLVNWDADAVIDRSMRIEFDLEPNTSNNS